MKSASSYELATRLLDFLAADLECGKVDDLAALTAMKMVLTPLPAKISLHQRTVSPALSPTFAIYMLKVDGVLIGVNGEVTWDEATLRGCSHVVGHYHVDKPHDRLFSELSDKIFERATTLAPRLQSTIDAWQLGDEEVHDVSARRVARL